MNLKKGDFVHHRGAKNNVYRIEKIHHEADRAYPIRWVSVNPVHTPFHFHSGDMNLLNLYPANAMLVIALEAR